MFTKSSKCVLGGARLVVMGGLLQVDNLKEEIRCDLIQIESVKQTLAHQDFILCFGGKAWL